MYTVHYIQAKQDKEDSNAFIDQVPLLQEEQD